MKKGAKLNEIVSFQSTSLHYTPIVPTVLVHVIAYGRLRYQCNLFLQNHQIYDLVWFGTPHFTFGKGQ